MADSWWGLTENKILQSRYPSIKKIHLKSELLYCSHGCIKNRVKALNVSQGVINGIHGSMISRKRQEALEQWDQSAESRAEEGAPQKRAHLRKGSGSGTWSFEWRAMDPTWRALAGEKRPEVPLSLLPAHQPWQPPGEEELGDGRWAPSWLERSGVWWGAESLLKLGTTGFTG